MNVETFHGTSLHGFADYAYLISTRCLLIKKYWNRYQIISDRDTLFPNPQSPIPQIP